MYSLEIIAGMAVLLLVLFAAAAWIAMARARRSAKTPRFEEDFIGELNRLADATQNGSIQDENTQGEANLAPTSRCDSLQENDSPQETAYALFQRGEPAFRIASTLKIARADAELLIRIEESLRRNSTE